MDVPATIHRRTPSDREMVIACGPLVIMAHGLLALAPADRVGCWISTEIGDLSPYDAERALRGWSAPH